MEIKDYYKRILAFCADTPLIINFHLDFEEIDINVGYFSGLINLVDGSNLHISEFVEISGKEIKRPKYRYHWQKSNPSVIARWDNAPHYKNLKSSPDHLHKDDKVIDSEKKDLFKVLSEIEKLIV
ncbi:DUF6516 family protein [Candidatus Margulisiibacteriota bacterium]